MHGIRLGGSGPSVCCLPITNLDGVRVSNDARRVNISKHRVASAHYTNLEKEIHTCYSLARVQNVHRKYILETLSISCVLYSSNNTKFLRLKQGKLRGPDNANFCMPSEPQISTTTQATLFTVLRLRKLCTLVS